MHSGTIHTSVPLTFTAPPGAGDQVVHVTVTYQARDHSMSLAPSTVHLELPVNEVAHVGRTLPTTTEGRP